MFNQCELKYCFGDLEPVLDAITVETHYKKHHAVYTANLNSLVNDHQLETDICKLLKNLSDIEDGVVRTAVRNNGGGYYNHNLYFEELSPSGKKIPEGALGDKINETFGSFDSFKEKISLLAMVQFGSGWAWMSVDEDNELVLSNTPNQVNPIIIDTGIPIFAIDVWEHAYYLKYKNLRAEYVKKFFDIVDWEVVEERYNNALNA